jgi:methyl-accepting chemotaxis protein
MMRRQMWPFKNLDSSQLLRNSVIGYLIGSCLLLSLTIVIYFATGSPFDHSQSFTTSILHHAPLILGAAHLMGIGLMIVLIRKCHHCRIGPGQRITTALKKMCRGDLGWKITLRRGDELSEVAESVTRASESLADRINKLQLQTRQLLEIENYLIDSVGAERISSPYTIKALRKLKICTSRLNSHMEDFQISTVGTVKTGVQTAPIETVEEVEQT